MDWKKEWKPLALGVGAFLACYYLPAGWERFQNAVLESLQLVRWYAREHVVLCLVPAFFIAGAIGVFVSQASVMKYLGAGANKGLAYGVASVSGTILAVCSCTVLPLFSGIYKMGAGLGPAVTFLYSGPAINVLAIILTARVLGLELGVARAIGAVVFSVVIGLCMHVIFRKEEMEKVKAQAAMPEPEAGRPLWRTAIYFALMVAILVFANWGKPMEDSGLWYRIYAAKWMITGAVAIVFTVLMVAWFKVRVWKMAAVVVPVALVAVLGGFTAWLEPLSRTLRMPVPMLAFIVGVVGFSIVTSGEKGEVGEWFHSSWGFAKQILPLLLIGVLIAGLLLGQPGGEGLIPSTWVSRMVGGNSFFANFFASVAGAFMYFATLTEVPILQGLIANGMGEGPALALLLAGPALSLPNMLVIRSVMGTNKTVVFVGLVIVMATISGMIFGAVVGR